MRPPELRPFDELSPGVIAPAPVVDDEAAEDVVELVGDPSLNEVTVVYKVLLPPPDGVTITELMMVVASGVEEVELGVVDVVDVVLVVEGGSDVGVDVSSMDDDVVGGGASLVVGNSVGDVVVSSGREAVVGSVLAGGLDGTVVVGDAGGVDVGKSSLVLVVVLLDIVKRRNFSLERSLELRNMLAILRGKSMTQVHGLGVVEN